MRAGLLAVVLALPVLVIGGAMGPYEEAKGWALQVLVGLTALAWLAGWALGRRPGAGEAMPRVLAWSLAAYGAWWCASTLASVAPGQSLWGNFARGHGLLVMLAALLVLPLVHAGCRDGAAVRSLVDATLVGSVPVCLVALAQALGWRGLPVPWDPSIRELTVRSTLGQHVFLGSYLAVLTPLAVARLVSVLPGWRSAGGWHAPGARALALGAAWIAGACALLWLGARWPVAWSLLLPWGAAAAVAWMRIDRGHAARAPGRLAVALLAALIALHLAVVVLSTARAPLLGLLAGLTVAVGLIAARRRAWRAVWGLALGVVAVVAILVVLNVRGPVHQTVRRIPLFTRLATIADVSHRTPGWVRLQIWHGVLEGWRRQLAGEEVIPGLAPLARSIAGYGLETEMFTLDRLAAPYLGSLRAHWGGQLARYVTDRAHNELLEHAVTGGLVAVVLWLVALGAVGVVGVRRIRDSLTVEEAALRIGCLGAAVAHVADAQLGPVTPLSRALFWLVAGLLTLPAWPAPAATRERRPAPPRLRPARLAVVALAAGLLVAVAWTSTSSLLASIAYTRGTRAGIAGRLDEAHADFERAHRLAPWLSATAEALGNSALALAAREGDAGRRAALLSGAGGALARTRPYLTDAVFPWALAGQVAYAQARAGDAGKRAVARASFAAAARQRPDDAGAQASLALTILDDGDAAQAHALAMEAVRRDARGWLGWAVLARASVQLGDVRGAEQAAARARAEAPPGASRVVESLLR